MSYYKIQACTHYGKLILPFVLRLLSADVVMMPGKTIKPGMAWFLLILKSRPVELPVEICDGSSLRHVKPSGIHSAVVGSHYVLLFYNVMSFVLIFNANKLILWRHARLPHPTLTSSLACM